MKDKPNPPPSWCTKPKPCDYDRGSTYCPHRECRISLENRLGQEEVEHEATKFRAKALQESLDAGLEKYLAALSERDTAIRVLCVVEGALGGNYREMVETFLAPYVAEK